MSETFHFIGPFAASLLIAFPSFAQSPAPQAEAPVRAAPAGDDQVQDLTSTTLASPPPAPAPAVAPQPAPAPTPSAAAAAPPPPPAPAGTVQFATPSPSPESAEASGRVHQGFYLRVVSAPAILSLSGTGPRGSAKIGGFGSGATIALGGTIAPGLVLGGMVQATQAVAKFSGGPYAGSTVTTYDGKTFTASRKASVSTSALALMLDWYPKATGGWHAGLNAGLGTVAVQNLADDSTMFGTGLTGGLFGGYDWSIGKAWSLGLALSISGTTSAKLKDSEDTNIDTGYRLRSVAFGLGASILYF